MPLSTEVWEAVSASRIGKGDAGKWRLRRPLLFLTIGALVGIFRPSYLSFQVMVPRTKHETKQISWKIL